VKSSSPSVARGFFSKLLDLIWGKVGTKYFSENQNKTRQPFQQAARRAITSVPCGHRLLMPGCIQVPPSLQQTLEIRGVSRTTSVAVFAFDTIRQAPAERVRGRTQMMTNSAAPTRAHCDMSVILCQHHHTANQRDSGGPWSRR